MKSNPFLFERDAFYSSYTMEGALPQRQDERSEFQVIQNTAFYENTISFQNIKPSVMSVSLLTDAPTTEIAPQPLPVSQVKPISEDQLFIYSTVNKAQSAVRAIVPVEDGDQASTEVESNGGFSVTPSNSTHVTLNDVFSNDAVQTQAEIESAYAVSTATLWMTTEHAIGIVLPVV